MNNAFNLMKRVSEERYGEMTGPTMTMMVGFPGSGKSFVANKIANENTIIVSSDKIREELYGSEEIQGDATEVFELVHKRVRAALEQGNDVILDATNLSAKKRKAFISSLPRKVKRRAYVVCTDIPLIFKQNSSRERVVPEEVIWRMIRNFQMPRPEEGWDEIICHSNENNDKVISEYLQAKGFNQENHHHSMSLDEHLESAMEYVYSPSEKKRLIMSAALFHDIGKIYTKTFYTRTGELDTEAHYYNHADVGAYIVACKYQKVWESENLMGLVYDISEFKMLISLIQRHMDYYIYFPSSEAENKMKEYYGSEMALLLRELHEVDVKSY